MCDGSSNKVFCVKINFRHLRAPKADYCSFLLKEWVKMRENGI